MYSKSEGGSSGMKPDKTCHKPIKGEKTAKTSKMPGQMYVPKKDHNESDFAGEKR